MDGGGLEQPPAWDGSKESLRRRFRRLRRGALPAAAAGLREVACRDLPALLPPGSWLGLYWPVGSEPDLDPWAPGGLAERVAAIQAAAGVTGGPSAAGTAAGGHGFGTATREGAAVAGAPGLLAGLDGAWTGLERTGAAMVERGAATGEGGGSAPAGPAAAGHPGGLRDRGFSGGTGGNAPWAAATGEGGPLRGRPARPGERRDGAPSEPGAGGAARRDGVAPGAGAPATGPCGARLALPAVLPPRPGEARGRLIYLPWQPDTPLRRDACGIPAPLPPDGLDPVALPPEALGLLVVPALSVDRDGLRLGSGGGWYDRLRADAAWAAVPALAVLPAACVVKRLPRDPWDVPFSGWLDEHGLWGAGAASMAPLPRG